MVTVGAFAVRRCLPTYLVQRAYLPTYLPTLPYPTLPYLPLPTLPYLVQRALAEFEDEHELLVLAHRLDQPHDVLSVSAAGRQPPFGRCNR